MTTILVPDLKLRQAKIRNIQRDRLDVIHNELHQLERDFFREEIGGTRKIDVKESITKLHEIIHQFMKGFDEAVLIHERMNQILSDERPDLTDALLPVLTKKDNHDQYR